MFAPIGSWCDIISTRNKRDERRRRVTTADDEARKTKTKTGRHSGGSDVGGSEREEPTLGSTNERNERTDLSFPTHNNAAPPVLSEVHAFNARTHCTRTGHNHGMYPKAAVGRPSKRNVSLLSLMNEFELPGRPSGNTRLSRFLSFFRRQYTHTVIDEPNPYPYLRNTQHVMHHPVLGTVQ